MESLKKIANIEKLRFTIVKELTDRAIILSDTISETMWAVVDEANEKGGPTRVLHSTSLLLLTISLITVSFPL